MHLSVFLPQIVHDAQLPTVLSHSFCPCCTKHTWLDEIESLPTCLFVPYTIDKRRTLLKPLRPAIGWLAGWLAAVII